MSFAKAQMIVKSIGLVTMVTCPFWMLSLFYSGDYQHATALALVPLIVALNMVIALRIARRDPFLHLLLPIAILFKLAGCGLYIYMVLNILGGGDVGLYFETGGKIASLYHITGEWHVLSPFWSSNFVFMVSGALQILVGHSLPAVSVIFGMVSFWGEYFCYRAFCTAFPNGDRYVLGLLLFFLPSIVFWPATIGKDALIMFFIGLAVFGFALINAGVGPKAVLCLSLGLLGATLVRPHIGAMLVISMTVPYLVATHPRGAAAFWGKMLGMAVLMAGTYFITLQAGSFLRVDDLSGGVKEIESVNRNNRFGPAGFGKEESFATKALSAPVLLLRPFIWEVHNLPSMLASIESLLLFLFGWQRRREIVAVVGKWKVHSFVAFLIIYTVQFSIIFAGAMSNFGLLVRERVMLLPFALMLITSIAYVRRPGGALNARFPISSQRFS